MTGACGLCTATSTAPTPSGASATSAIRDGQRLDQVDGFTRDDGVHLLGEVAVVHGVGEVVRRGRRAGVDVQDDVDDELLPLAALEVEDAVETLGAQTDQLDPVREGGVGRRGHVAAPLVQARATRTASRVGGTSCTRTAQTPAAAASALVAAVAASRSGGRDGPVGAGEQVTEEALARGAHQHRLAEAQHVVETLQHLPVLVAALGEPEPGVEHEQVGVEPDADEVVDPRPQLVAHGGGDAAAVVVDRERLHVGAVARASASPRTGRRRRPPRAAGAGRRARR